MSVESVKCDDTTKRFGQKMNVRPRIAWYETPMTPKVPNLLEERAISS